MGMWGLIFIFTTVFCAWYVGYQSRENYFTRRHKDLSRDYLVGLNYLLNEEPDKAVDVFIKMLEVDSDTVETHLAIGKLFRRRGEVDRAIRIHQNLIARPNLDKAYREQSIYALGQDYYSAGMLDRAEKIFLDVVEIKQYSVPALRCLLDIYQQEKAWENAILTANKLQAATKKNMQPIVAHYYCELAEISVAKNSNEQASHYLKMALETDANCVRASLLLARLEMNKNNYKIALKYLKRIKNQNPDYLAEAIHSFATCHENLETEDELMNYLTQVLEEHPHSPVAFILAEQIRKRKGDKVAAGYVADYVRRYPSLSGLNLFLQLHLSSTEGRVREDLTILQNLMKKLLANKPEYQCVSCGFSGKSLHWQCPGCKQWSSVKPVHCLES